MDRPIARRFGPYELTEPLGRGAFGVVYRAVHRRLGRPRAVKVLSPKLAASEELVRRFAREANLAAGLRHPNIVLIHDIGVARGTHYIAMELVEGVPLGPLLREQRPLPPGRALGLLGQLAEALDYAHSRGVVHRDIKPSNVIVGPGDRVTLVDFGIARALDRPAGGRLTQSSTYLGTPEYMAPEVITGDEGGVGNDLYALGVLAYEMLVGRVPFGREQALQVLYAQVHEPPPAPRSLRPELPETVEAALLRQLAKDPAERFRSADEFVSALRGFEVAAPGAPSTGQSQTASLRRAAGNLPILPTALLGRERETAEVGALLRRADVRLVTLTGPGGVGKTRLALEAAQHLADGFGDGVYLVELAPVRDPGLVPATIAHVLGVREAPGRPLTDALTDYLREMWLLLLLDNFEQVVAAAPFLARLLAECAGLKLLVTSREVLRLRGEHEYPLAPLALPELGGDADVAALARNPAVALFCRQARAAKPDFALTEENAAAVAEIAVRLEGLPLSLELAAARVKLLPPAALLARLETRLKLLIGGARDLPERHQTLRDSLAWSYDLLGSGEQRLLRRLAVFAGGWTLEAAEAVCGGRADLGIDALEGLASLIDKSIVLREDGHDPSRFRMLETIREFGAERLATSGEEAKVREAFSAFYLALAGEAARALDGPAEREWLERLQVEHDNLRAALSWSLANGRETAGLCLAGTLRGFWQVRGYWSEGRAWLDQALAKVANVAPAGRAEGIARAKALAALGSLATLQGAYAEAGPPLEESLRLFRALEDEAGTAAALNDLGYLSIYKGDFEAAEAHISESLALSRASGDTKAIARSLYNQATIATFQGNLELWQSFARESLAAWREIQGKRGIAGALMSLGSRARYTSDYGTARKVLEEALALQRELQDRRGMAQTLGILGYSVLLLGDAAAAQPLVEEAIALSRQLGDRWTLASQLGGLGLIAQRRGDRGLARQSFRHGLEIYAQLQDKSRLVLHLYHLGYLWQDEGEVRRAVRLYGAANTDRLADQLHSHQSERALWDDYQSAARTALGEEAFAAAWAEGEAMTLERAIAYALEEPAEA
jgi:non-specific serine/threonine protein kinase